MTSARVGMGGRVRHKRGVACVADLGVGKAGEEEMVCTPAAFVLLFIWCYLWGGGVLFVCCADVAAVANSCEKDTHCIPNEGAELYSVREVKTKRNPTLPQQRGGRGGSPFFAKKIASPPHHFFFCCHMLSFCSFMSLFSGKGTALPQTCRLDACTMPLRVLDTTGFLGMRPSAGEGVLPALTFVGIVCSCVFAFSSR